MQQHYRDFYIRDWQPCDRTAACSLIKDVLAEYGLVCEPQGADQDVWDVETYYQQAGGQFWVVEQQDQIVGTAAYYPVKGNCPTVEIRKMYLRPLARGQGLGRFLLQALEQNIIANQFETIRIETASVLKEAVQLYETSGYTPDSQVETQRCDRAYYKKL
ncbi:MAG: GNAT family N-acetyltransferase [Thainema sp.]